MLHVASVTAPRKHPVQSRPPAATWSFETWGSMPSDRIIPLSRHDLRGPASEPERSASPLKTLCNTQRIHAAVLVTDGAHCNRRHTAGSPSRPTPNQTCLRPDQSSETSSCRTLNHPSPGLGRPRAPQHDCASSAPQLAHRGAPRWAVKTRVRARRLRRQADDFLSHVRFVPTRSVPNWHMLGPGVVGR